MADPTPSQDAHTLAVFKTDAARLLRHFEQTRRPLILKRLGQRAAVLLDVQEYERLTEATGLLRDVRAAEDEPDAGGGHAHDDAKALALARLARG